MQIKVHEVNKMKLKDECCVVMQIYYEFIHFYFSLFTCSFVFFVLIFCFSFLLCVFDLLWFVFCLISTVASVRSFLKRLFVCLKSVCTANLCVCLSVETLLDDFMLTHPIFLTADRFQQVLLQQYPSHSHTFTCIITWTECAHSAALCTCM